MVKTGPWSGKNQPGLSCHTRTFLPQVVLRVLGFPPIFLTRSNAFFNHTTDLTWSGDTSLRSLLILYISLFAASTALILPRLWSNSELGLIYFSVPTKPSPLDHTDPNTLRH